MDEGLVSQYHEDIDDCWNELSDMIRKDLCDYEDLRYTSEEYAQIQKEWNEYEDNRRRAGLNALKNECCPWAHKERERMRMLQEEKEE